MIVTIGNLAPTKARVTKKPYKDVGWILNYAASHPVAIICYKASDTIMRIHADASYLSVSRACIRANENHYSSDNSYNPPNNGSVKTICKIMGNVMGLASEAEIGSTYINY